MSFAGGADATDQKNLGVISGTLQPVGLKFFLLCIASQSSHLRNPLFAASEMSALMLMFDIMHVCDLGITGHVIANQHSLGTWFSRHGMWEQTCKLRGFVGSTSNTVCRARTCAFCVQIRTQTNLRSK